MLEMRIGHTKRYAVSAERFSSLLKTRDVLGCGTALLVAIIEWASVKFLEDEILPHEISIGNAVAIRHVALDLFPQNFTVELQITEQDSSEVTFTVMCTSEDGDVGAGVHTRSVVSRTEIS